jgi:hypothetical protein
MLQRLVFFLVIMTASVFATIHLATPVTAEQTIYQSFDFTGADGASVPGMVSNMKIKDNQLYYDGLGEKWNDFGGEYGTLMMSYDFKFSAFDTSGSGNNFGFDFNTGNGADRKRVNLDIRSSSGSASNAIYMTVATVGQSWTDNASNRLNRATPVYNLNQTYRLSIVFDKVMIGTTEKYVISAFIDNVWFLEVEYAPNVMTAIKGFALFARNAGNIYFDNLVLESVPDVLPDGSRRRSEVGKLYSAYSFDNLNTSAMVPGFAEGNFRPTAGGEYTSTYGSLTGHQYNKFHVHANYSASTNLNPQEGVFSVDAKIANRGTFNRFSIDFNAGNYASGKEYRLNVNIHSNGNAYMDLSVLNPGSTLAASWNDSANTITRNLKLSFDTYYTYKLYFEKNASGYYVLSAYVDDVLALEYTTAVTSMGTQNVQMFGLIVSPISDAGGANTSDVTFDNLYIAALKDRYVDGSALRKSGATKTYANYTFETNGTVPLFADKENSGFVLSNGVLKSATTNQFNVAKFLTAVNEFAFSTDVKSIGAGTGGLRIGYDTATFYDIHFGFTAGGGSVTVYQGDNRYYNNSTAHGGTKFNPGLTPDTVHRIGVIVETIDGSTSNLAVFVNGVCVIEAVVPKLSAGRLGLTSNNSDIEFDNVTVTAVGASSYYDGSAKRVGGTPQALGVLINYSGERGVATKTYVGSDTITLTSNVYQRNASATYQWRVNGNNVNGATSATVTLSPSDYFTGSTVTVDLLVNGSVQSNVLTFTVKTINISLTSVFDGENPPLEMTLTNVAYGTKMALEPQTQSGYQFAYWVVNGVVRRELAQNHQFVVTSQMNIQAIFAPEGRYAVVFLDSNGKLLDTQYVLPGATASDPSISLPNKPGLAVATPKWRSTVGATTLSNIQNHTVYILQYVKTSEATFTLAVTNGSGAGSYAFNDVATVAAEEDSEGYVFLRWEDGNGQILSYERSYAFTMLSNRTVVAVYGASSGNVGAVVSISADLGLRSTYSSYLGQFEVPEGAIVLEYGILTAASGTTITLSSPGITIHQANRHFEPTGEFLLSIPSAGHSVARAYLVFQIGDDVFTVYSNPVIRS